MRGTVQEWIQRRVRLPAKQLIDAFHVEERDADRS
jgi:hypothetical protein